MSPAFPPHCASRFQADRLLGEGGFGSVWLAHQIGLDRPVAIKFIRADVGADAEALERFKNEARVTASLQHPSIVRVIDHDVEDGVPWIAYEYLPGRSLSEVLAAGPLRWSEALQVGQQVAGALEEAHSKGVIHRDIKPENVLEVEPGRYKLADFGIAKWTAAAQIKTRTGFLMGTPTHVPPEQIQGDPPSPQGDVYALGVVLYQMLTGRLPFEHDNVLTLLNAHLKEQAATPSRLQAGLPPGVDELVKRALGKKPAERYADGAELRRAIEEVAARPAPADDAGPAASARPADVPPRLNTSRTRLPRAASGATRPVSRPDPAPLAPPPPRRAWPAVALAAGVCAAAIAAFLGLVAPTPHPAPTGSAAPPPVAPSASAPVAVAPSASAPPAPAPLTARDVTVRLDAVRTALYDFDRREVRVRDELTGNRIPAAPDAVRPHLERALRLTVEVVRAMQEANLEGPVWAEDLVLQTDQVLQRAQRLSPAMREGPIVALVGKLDAAASRTTQDPWRRALAYTVHARVLQLADAGSAKAAREFEQAVHVLDRETPAAWGASLRGLRVRLTIAYQWASSVERSQEFYMMGGMPPEVSTAWERVFADGAAIEARYAKVDAVTESEADDYWEVNWQLLRSADRVVRVPTHPPATLAHANRILAQTVSRLLRVRGPVAVERERDRRLGAVAQALRGRSVTLKLADGTTWPGPK